MFFSDEKIIICTTVYKGNICLQSECDVLPKMLVLNLLGFKKNSVFSVVSDSVLKQFGLKKYRIRYCKNLVSEKVSDLIS